MGFDTVLIFLLQFGSKRNITQKRYFQKIYFKEEKQQENSTTIKKMFLALLSLPIIVK
jgi:hypothetical protein